MNSAKTIPSIPLKRLGSVVVAPCVGLAAVVAILYVQDRRHELTIAEHEGEHLVELQSEIVIHEFAQVRADLLYLSGQQMLRRFLSGDEAARAPLESDYIRFCRRKGVYDQVRCIDMSGNEIVRVNFEGGTPAAVPWEQLQEKTSRYYFQQALELQTEQVLVSPFDLNVEHDVLERPFKPVVRFLTPALDESADKRGVLILNYLGDRLLHKLSQVSQRARGTSVLLNSQGDYLLSARAEDAWGWMLGHERTFGGHYPRAWQMISQRDAGQFFVNKCLYTFRRVPLPELGRYDLDAVGQVASQDCVDPDMERSDPSLLIVSFAPSQVLYARSAKLLTQLVFIYVGACVVVTVLGWHWAHAATLREAHEKWITRSESRLRKLSAQLLTAQEEERRNLSRQLHDELGQQVTAITLDLKSAARQTVPDRANRLLDRAVEETEQLLTNLHEIATRVRPCVLDDLGLHEAVESYLDDFSRRTGITVDSELQFDRHDVPAMVGENVYRILQEALTNVAKHAHTSQVSIMIKVDDQRIRVQVRDRGVGFAAETFGNSRLGILGMQERAELLHGSFRMSSTHGDGSCIEVIIPLSTT